MKKKLLIYMILVVSIFMFNNIIVSAKESSLNGAFSSLLDRAFKIYCGLSNCAGISDGVCGSSHSDELSVNNMIQTVGGKKEYCNKDGNGNLASCRKVGIETKMVCIAYTQIGYKEKRSNDSIDQCISNMGNNNYQKYSNGSSMNWQDNFVNWVEQKYEYNVKKRSDQCYVNKLREGDFISFYANYKYKGILYKNVLTNKWHMILGNWENGVIDTEINFTSTDNIITNLSFNNSHFRVTGCEYNSIPTIPTDAIK